MRNQLKTFYSALLIVATLGLTSTVHGVPAFARQTGLDCNSCHAAQGFPTLNAFGAAFKAGGYSQANEDNLLGDGEALSIPKTLNMSVVLKARNPIEGTTAVNGDTTSKSQLEMPDEMAFLVGGRTGVNQGFLIESALGFAGNEAVSAKYVFAPEIGPVRLGIVPWYTDLGVGYMFETQSTGMARNIRPAEKVKGAANMLGFTDDGTGYATGLGIYVWHPMGFLAFTPYFGAAGTTWSDINAAGTDNAADIAYYIRLAATPTFGDVAMSIGGAFWTGKHETINVSGFVVDAAADMDVGLPLSIELSFGMDLNGETYGATTGTTGLDSVMALEAYVEAGVIPDVAMVGLLVAYGSQTAPSLVTTDLEFGLVGKYHVVRNVKLELDFIYTTHSNDANSDTSSEWLLMPMIFGAF